MTSLGQLDIDGWNWFIREVYVRYINILFLQNLHTGLEGSSSNCVDSDINSTCGKLYT